jgi:hypothetical protein
MEPPMGIEFALVLFMVCMLVAMLVFTWRE